MPIDPHRGVTPPIWPHCDQPAGHVPRPARLRRWLLAIVLRWGKRLCWRALHRAPDFVIGGEDAPYLRRWWIIPRNPLLNIYLHQILRSDGDRELHDHPWCNVSIILAGGYIERMPIHPRQAAGFDFVEGYTIDKIRTAGSVVFRTGTSRHRLLLLSEVEPCWSLFVTGPYYRFFLWLHTRCMWGFYCRTGFVPWRRFVDPADKGRVGRGCGEP